MQSFRTGVSIQGRKSTAICLEDLRIRHTNKQPGDVVKSSKTGANHVAQDYTKGNFFNKTRYKLTFQEVYHCMGSHIKLLESLTLAANDGTKCYCSMVRGRKAWCVGERLPPVLQISCIPMIVAWLRGRLDSVEWNGGMERYLDNFN